jgi:hypothetical protein
VSKLCQRLRTTDGVVSVGGLLDLPAGGTRLLNAPTGIGKSVVMEVVACWMAAYGLVVSIVVPTNTDVLKLTRAVEQDLEALGVTASATALMSPSTLFETTQKVVRTRPAWDPTGEWTTDRLGYGCALAAAAETESAVDSWAAGAEPCTTLRPAGEESGTRRGCPWRTTCGKFRLARAALDAYVIVTSHANFHSGRLHLPVRDERGLTDRTTVEELIFRRSHLVVIDEIDAFQSNVVSQAARGLVLDRRGSTRTPLHDLEADYVQAAGRINRDVESSVRDMVHHSKFLASLYTAALTFGTIGVDSAASAATGRYWLVPRRWDGALTAQLYGLPDHEHFTPEMINGFQSLFPGGGSPRSDEPAHFASVRRVLATVTEVGNGAKSLRDSRGRLDELLTAHIADDRARAKAINRLLQRAILERLRKHLRQFVYDAPHLATAGVPAAREIAETFGPYSRWRALPNGPLGRLLFAFSHHVDPSGRLPAQLNAAAFGGDPHVYTTTLADITALCRAGTRRAVLGLSATAFFPQAPHHHVHLDPHWWVTDDDQDSVRILPAYITEQTTDERRLVRVWGTEGARRGEALRRLAELLWPTRLDQELQRLADLVRLEAERPPDPRDRGLVQPHRLGHRPGRPVAVLVGRPLFEGLRDHGLNLPVSDLSRRSRTRLVSQPVHPTDHEPLPPLADRRQRHTQSPGDLTVGQTLRARQHDPRPPHQRLRRLRPTRQPLQRRPFLDAQSQRRQLGTTTITHTTNLSEN